jgi:hypothetical protein
LAFEIGSDFGDEPYLFGAIRDIALGPQGVIAVLDGMTGEVRVFDAEGGYLRRFGGFSGGPEEFTTPTALLETDSTVRVIDPPVSRVTEFRWSGELVEARRVAFPDGIRTALAVPAAVGKVFVDRYGHMAQLGTARQRINGDRPGLHPRFGSGRHSGLIRSGRNPVAE